MRNLQSKIQDEISKSRPGHPVLIADLRKSLRADPEGLNRAVMELVKAGECFLSRCAKPLASLSQGELDGMIPDGQGKYFDIISTRDQADRAFKPGRGGFRPGSGRPMVKLKDRKVVVSFRMKPWIIDWLQGQGEKPAVLIEAALIGFYGLTEPE